MPKASTPKRQVPVDTRVNEFSDHAPLLAGPQLEAEIVAIGAALTRTLDALLNAVARTGSGPVALAAALGLDKVLASRVLKALRAADPIAALFFMPGPEPLRALVRAASRRGAARTLTEEATLAVDRFEWLIQRQVGDRSLLDSILSAWIPEARQEFELRRKQAAFKAMSQLKGAQADTIFATCVLAPSRDGALLDVIWVHGLTGLHRVRPGVSVKVASRRMSAEPNARRPMNLDLREIDGSAVPLVPEYCSQPTPPVQVRHVQEALFYTLGGDGFGVASSVDIFFAEVNLAEMKRSPQNVTSGWYFFAETSVPAKALQFDLLVHEDVFPGQDPTLRLHDTVLEGVADVYDARRDLDRLDMLESITPLGRGLAQVRSARGAAYGPLMRTVCERLAYDTAAFRGYRCGIDYPVYGSQVSMLFAARAGN